VIDVDVDVDVDVWSKKKGGDEERSESQLSLFGSWISYYKRGIRAQDNVSSDLTSGFIVINDTLVHDLCFKKNLGRTVAVKIRRDSVVHVPFSYVLLFKKKKTHRLQVY